MSENSLHIFAPTRFDTVGAIVGDYAALTKLRDAITDAIDSGTGGVYMLHSDGDGYSLAVLRANDMGRVCSPQPGEVGTRRATRQTIGIRALPRFLEAIQKSRPPLQSFGDIPRFLSARIRKAGT